MSVISDLIKKLQPLNLYSLSKTSNVYFELSVYASELENMTLESINIKDHQEERMPAVAEYLETFAKEVGPNVSNKKEYFNKLNETASDLKSMNLDSAKTKIEEAKKLREAK